MTSRFRGKLWNGDIKSGAVSPWVAYRIFKIFRDVGGDLEEKRPKD